MAQSAADLVFTPVQSLVPGLKRVDLESLAELVAGRQASIAANEKRAV